MARHSTQSESTERELFERAAVLHSDWEADDGAAETVRDISAREGSDFATAWLYQRICSSAAHGDFIRRIENFADERGSPTGFDAIIAIVPGGFYREYPRSGADGRVVLEAARTSGLDAEVVPIRSFGRLEENVNILCHWLGRQRRPVVLASLCKGSAEVRLALARSDAVDVFRRVQAWISLSGIPFGSPMIPWILASPLRRFWYRALLGVQGYDFQTLRQLDRRPGAPLADDFDVPPSLPTIHVVGFPLRCHLTTRLVRRCHRRVLSLGPSDGGGVLLADVLRLPGQFFPVWGADHYLRPTGQDMTRLVRAILHSLDEARGLSATQTKEASATP